MLHAKVWGPSCSPAGIQLEVGPGEKIDLYLYLYSTTR